MGPASGTPGRLGWNNLTLRHTEPSVGLTQLLWSPLQQHLDKQHWWFLLLRFPVQIEGCVLRGGWGLPAALGCASGWGRRLRLGLCAPHSPAGPHPGVKHPVGLQLVSCVAMQSTELMHH